MKKIITILAVLIALSSCSKSNTCAQQVKHNDEQRSTELARPGLTSQQRTEINNRFDAQKTQILATCK